MVVMLTLAALIFRHRLLSLMVGALVLLGCDRSPQSSGIPSALNTDAVLLSVGARQGISVDPQTSGASQGGATSDSERNLTAKIDTGTPGQLLAAYREEVRKQIQQRGAVIHGDQRVGSEHEVRDFAFRYTWKGNEGLIRVRSVSLPDGRINFSQFCYEHRQ